MAILEPGKPVPLWVYGGGAVALAGVFFLYRSRSARNKAAAAATPKQAAATATSTPVVPAASYGNATNAGALANISQQLASLNAAQATTQGAASASGVNTSITANAENQILQGSGYYPKPDATGNRSQRISANGHTYVWVPNPDVANALGGFNNLFIQPVPGLFTKNTPGTVLNNANGATPLFAQVA